MTNPALAFAILAATVILFISGRMRVDVVAVLALVTCVIVGLVPADAAFSGFGHPAVITVAAVLALSSALSRSGAIDLIAIRINRLATGRTSQMLTLSGLGGVLSGFMNNVGALALLMPVAISMARKTGYHPGTILMPLAFATILGGLITLIGTPPNLLIAQYRADALGESFAMFDFLWVGGPIAVIGIAFVTLVGWRLLPQPASDRSASDDPFHVDGYLTEFVVPEDSKLIGQTLEKIAESLDEAPSFVGMIRRRQRVVRHVRHTALQAGDVIIATGDTTAIEEAVGKGLTMVAAKDLAKEDGSGPIDPKALTFTEVVVPPNAWIEGRSPALLSLRARYAVNVLAVASEAPWPTPSARLVAFRWRSGNCRLSRAGCWYRC